MNTNILNFKTMKINYLTLNLMKTTKFFLGAFFCLTLITSCSDDDDNPAPVLEEELITNVTLTFVNNDDPLDIVTMASVAPDGQDGASTELVSGTFTSGETYALTLVLTNESEDPAEDVLNDDIIPEADEHFFVYAVNGINLTLSRDDDDVDASDSEKLGLNTTWVAGAASTGNVQIILVHEPEGADDSDEFGSVTGGSEDINITFSNVEIQ